MICEVFEMADYVDVSTLEVKENRYHDLDMFYDNKRMFADREKDSAELLDFLDQLNNAGVDYEEYKHKTDPGCTIFYDDNKSLTEARDFNKVQKRIARVGEFDNGYVMHSDWKVMSIEDSEEQARMKSLENPDDVFYVQYDDIMNPSSDIKWKAGKQLVEDSGYDDDVTDLHI